MDLALDPSQPVPTSPASPGPLSPGQLQELAAARTRAKKIRRAASVAAFSGWTMAFFAALTLLGGLVSFSIVGIILGAGLGAIAFVELRGSALFRRIDLRAPRLLALNQAAFGLLLLAYAAWSLISGLMTPLAGQLQSGDPDTDALIGGLTRAVTIGLYGSLAVVAIVSPGLTAWYYLSRARHMRRYLADTPPWVVQILRTA